MIRARKPIQSLSVVRITSVLALLAVVTPLFAQQNARPLRRPRQRGSGIVATFTTFPNLPKVLKFEFVTLDHSKFNSSLAYVATLPKGFGGKLQKEQQVLFMCYGYKKGGNTRMYETPAVPGVTPEQMTHLIADAHIFKDVNRDDKWQVKGKIINGVFVTSTSNENGVNDAALAAVTTKHWLR